MICTDSRSTLHGIAPRKDRIHSEQVWVYTPFGIISNEIHVCLDWPIHMISTDARWTSYGFALRQERFHNLRVWVYIAVGQSKDQIHYEQV